MEEVHLLSSYMCAFFFNTSFLSTRLCFDYVTIVIEKDVILDAIMSTWCDVSVSCEIDILLFNLYFLVRT